MANRHLPSRAYTLNNHHLRLIRLETIFSCWLGVFFFGSVTRQTHSDHLGQGPAIDLEDVRLVTPPLHQSPPGP